MSSERQSDSLPLVSVILATYNRALVINGAIESVLRQSYVNLELLIVDDASTDMTKEVVEGHEDNRIRYVALDKNGGVSRARNHGIRLSKGEYIAFVDSDDQWLPGKLQSQVELILKYDCLIVCGVIRLTGNRIRNYSPGKVRTPEKLDINHLVESMVTYTQSWLLPRNILEAVGCFDEELVVWEDFDLLIRIYENFQVVVMPQMGVLSIQSADSLTKNGRLFLTSLKMIIVKHQEYLIQHRKLWASMNYALIKMHLIYEFAPNWEGGINLLKTNIWKMKYFLIIIAQLVCPGIASRYLIKRSANQ